MPGMCMPSWTCINSLLLLLLLLPAVRLVPCLLHLGPSHAVRGAQERLCLPACAATTASAPRRLSV
jgi:hypothetical protein